MTKNRIFIGIPVPADIAKQLWEMLPGGELLKRSAFTNYHITLQFLGKVSNLSEVIEQFKSLTFNSFKISVDGISGFYKKGKLAVMYLSISEGKGEVTTLSQVVKSTFAAYDNDPNPVYTPHITVNRNIKAAELQSAEQLLTFKFAQPIYFEALHIYLYDSINLRDSGLYGCVSSVSANL
ncbi:RNA 2',3'-cyclic phosphodiesterase [Dyadobacter sandarakinus]|uniref:RNA 2',3'-cyclic phosphodiesterase n=1 Tax=Dyadobacter sandarakinus TaxID=2747268 RepID=A0ABX7I3Z1_9BACT|nr:RNA 2',3'-cyclic phosphodiesterase [Dyadobacter sandarakinus]QRR00789.1 RNA 2',3'-cyclic phosphodiesterase [Dyadobacter sandarakinus]